MIGQKAKDASQIVSTSTLLGARLYALLAEQLDSQEFHAAGAAHAAPSLPRRYL